MMEFPSFAQLSQNAYSMHHTVYSTCRVFTEEEGWGSSLWPTHPSFSPPPHHAKAKKKELPNQDFTEEKRHLQNDIGWVCSSRRCYYFPYSELSLVLLTFVSLVLKMLEILNERILIFFHQFLFPVPLYAVTSIPEMLSIQTPPQHTGPSDGKKCEIAEEYLKELCGIHLKHLQFSWWWMQMASTGKNIITQINSALLLDTVNETCFKLHQSLTVCNTKEQSSYKHLWSKTNTRWVILNNTRNEH